MKNKQHKDIENIITLNKVWFEVHLGKILQDYDIFYMDCLDDGQKAGYSLKFLLNQLADDFQGKLLVCYQPVYLAGGYKRRVYCMSAKSSQLTAAKLRGCRAFRKTDVTAPRAVKSSAEITKMTIFKLLFMNVPFAFKLNQQGKLSRCNIFGNLYFYVRGQKSLNNNDCIVLYKLNFGEYSETLQISNSLFTSIRMFKQAYGDKLKDKLEERNLLSGPFFKIDIIRRIFSQIRRLSDNCYLNAPLYQNEKPKTRDGALKFFALSNGKSFTQSKTGLAYHLLDAFNSYYEGTGYISKLTFTEIAAKTDAVQDSSQKLRKEQQATVDGFFKDKTIYLIDQTGKDVDLQQLKDYFEPKVGQVLISDQVKAGLNISVVLHAKEYQGRDRYQQSDQEKLVQHIYLDTCFHDGKLTNHPALDNCLKELLVKECIVQQTIEPLKVQGEPGAEFFYWDVEGQNCWKLAFKDDGNFEITASNLGFDPAGLENPFLQAGLLKEDDTGKKKTRYELLVRIAGVLYGIKPTDFRTIPNKSLYQKIRQEPNFRSYRNNQGLNEYLSGMIYENHWLHAGRVYFNVGKIGKGMNSSIERGSVVREISKLSGEIEEEEAKKLYRMLKMTQVTFVKYKELTVLPYPLKLLKEAAKMSWA